MYYYIRSEPGLYTVGFTDSRGRWHPDSDHASRESAARRVNYLNGGTTVYQSSDLIERVKSALGTGECGEALVEVARNAHAAELELATRIRRERDSE